MKKIHLLSYLLLLNTLLGIASTRNQSRVIIPLSGSEWYLWRDTKAEWKNDKLYLPSEVARLSTLSVNSPAGWNNDRLYLPTEVSDLSKLPVNPPTGGWESLNANTAKKVSVPGTVEEYMTVSDWPQPTDFSGVSWWFRTLNIPKDLKDATFILEFGAVRMRAEVYLDGQLVAYDIVGETPFEANVTKAIRPGEKQLLAVRVTNPGGNFHWQDFDVMNWGKYLIPPGRGFGGILGDVNLKALNPVYISDIYMQNTPQKTKVNAIISIRNLTDRKLKQNINLDIVEKNNPSIKIFSKQIKNHQIPQGDSRVTIEVDAPNAKIWDIESPNLYVSKVSLSNKDNDERTFGFRWFAPENIGEEATLKLNGRRIMLRSAISWGYWPVTGLIATPEMAEKQITTAKQLGLNMLNFHRNIGTPVVLDKADEMGLLYYEEPGSFHSGTHDPFIRTILREKVFRMIKRDRSHPSLIIYNMINEFGGRLSKDKELVAKRFEDMRDAHAIDPSRTITFTSGWANKKDALEDSKAHFRPFDTKLYMNGWFDNHRAGGPETWREDFYKSPTDNLMYTNNNTEIYMRGEEAAISTPPRIKEIDDYLSKTGKTGWDGKFWQKQYKEFCKFFADKNLEPYFKTVDMLTEKMGDISFEHQGRRIQGMRMQNLGDCYVINGWESMPYDNHSGVVDLYRNAKGDSKILAYYNQPLYVALSPRKQIIHTPNPVPVDFYIVNEKNLKGKHILSINVKDPNGKNIYQENKNVQLSGGEVFGELLIENMLLPLNNQSGMFSIEANLYNLNKEKQASGKDQVLGVNWDSQKLSGTGAIYKNDTKNTFVSFYKQETGNILTDFSENAGKLDWVVITRPPLDAPQKIQPEAYITNDDKPGIVATFFKDDDLREAAGTRTDTHIDFQFADGAQPDASVSANQPFSAIWKGKLMPSVSGQYLIAVNTDGGLRLSINGQRVIDEWGNKKMYTYQRPVTLEAGKAINIQVEYRQQKQTGTIQLQWSTPGNATLDPKSLIDRCKNDGTTLILLESAETWMDVISKYTNLKNKGNFAMGRNWVGGVHFVKAHPLFKDLPGNVGMSWPYQALVHDGDHRLGLKLEGEELVAGVYRSHGFNLGTAVGIIPCGKGKIIFSTLDIMPNLNLTSGSSDVAKKLIYNFIEYSQTR
ncbi:PA14 domain-containing protein [Coprobacter fastidiosus]|uniref:PA14 domain-containing protein n=1 Tax=Coprobacter fastidiosus TaxID=1099853 RepID=UPI0026751970|nr:PA14 domain-containing protein [Coprobacter fastidiosus]